LTTHLHLRLALRQTVSDVNRDTFTITITRPSLVKCFKNLQCVNRFEDFIIIIIIIINHHVHEGLGVFPVP
jgi:hypothetical protein